jgi:hypothetical protein
MGSHTDYEIAKWQADHGIEPACGSYSEVLEEVSQKCFELIKVIELERSGIRDGDGCWHGSDVIGGMSRDLRELARNLEIAERDNANN